MFVGLSISESANLRPSEDDADADGGGDPGDPAGADAAPRSIRVMSNDVRTEGTGFSERIASSRSC